MYALRPRLTEQLVSKHLKVQESIFLNHTNAWRSGTQLSKKNITKSNVKNELKVNNNKLDTPRKAILQTREQKVVAHLMSFEELESYIAKDLCGQYPTMSNKDIKYIFVLYDYNYNVILSRPMKLDKGITIIGVSHRLVLSLSYSTSIMRSQKNWFCQ